MCIFTLFYVSMQNFVMVNQKGIDALCLDIFAKEGILCLRRAKRRNMERMTSACGGSPIHSIEDMDESQLGYAGKVSEVTIDEDKFTFVEECKTPKSCTLLLQGPNKHTIDQIKDAVRDGLRAVKNALEDKAVVPGAGAYELAVSMHLRDVVAKATRGRAKIGVQAFADAMRSRYRPHPRIRQASWIPYTTTTRRTGQCGQSLSATAGIVFQAAAG